MPKVAKEMGLDEESIKEIERRITVNVIVFSVDASQRQYNDWGLFSFSQCLHSKKL